MALNHFKAKHFGAKSLSLLGHVAAIVGQTIDFIVTVARRLGRR